MKHLFTLALMGLASLCASPVQAQAPTTWTRTVSTATGSFVNKQNSTTSAYKYKWSSTETAPQLTLETANNDMWVDANGTYHLYKTTFSLSVPDGYAITGYSFNYTGFEGSSTSTTRATVTITPEKGGAAVTCSASDAAATVSVTGLEENTTRFSVSSTAAKANAVPTNFVVSIKKTASAIERLHTTTTANGRFAANTVWYTVAVGQGQGTSTFPLVYTADNQPFSLARSFTNAVPEALWCLVGDNTAGYRLHNRAAAADRLLVSPREMSGTTGGTAYPVVLPLDGLNTTTYESLWKLETSSDFPGMAAFYLCQNGTNYGVNNRDNKLAFWTGGKDRGSAVVFTPAAVDFEVGTTYGEFKNAANTPAETSLWNSTLTAPAALRLSTMNTSFQPSADGKSFLLTDAISGTYTLSTPTMGYVIDGYSFDYPSTLTAITTADGKVTQQSGHFEVSSVGKASTTFTVAGNGQVKNFRVFVRQADEVDNAHTVIVFDNATSKVPYRIPALTQTRDGRLLADCDYRISKTDIGYNNRNGLYRIDNVMKVSTDNGHTWSDTVVMASGDEHASQVWRTGFGDPSIVADRTSDNVLMQCVSGKVGYFSSTRNNPQRCAFFRSTDGGRTWDQGTDQTEQIYGLYDGTLPGNAQVAGIFLTSGKIMQSRSIKVGDFYRIYIAHPLRTTTVNKFATYVIYSDDFGRNWKVLGGAGVIPSDAADESKVEELPDGTVLLSCRNQGGGRQFNIFTYSDPITAAGTWDKSTMPANMTGGQVNACNGEVLVLPARRKADGKQLFVALQTVPLSNMREKVGFFYKELAAYSDYNSGEKMAANWVKGLQVTKNSSCYSTMILMQNDSIGLLFEDVAYNDGYNIIFKSFSLDSITGGKYTLDATSPRDAYLNDALQQRLAGIKTGKAVGMYKSDAALRPLLDAFNTQKTEANMWAVMAAVPTLERVTIEPGRQYMVYNKVNPTHFLSANAAQGSLYSVENDSAQVFTFEKDSNGNYLLHHVNTGLYAGKTSYSTRPVPAVKASEAIAFSVESNSEGWSLLTCTQPTSASYATLNNSTSDKVRPFNKQDQASFWCIYPSPRTITAITTPNISKDEQNRIYDLQGRRVQHPTHGLYILNGKKVAVN